METQCLAKNKKGERNMGLGISGFDEELDDCLNKVYTRDIYRRD